jgi:hypothetical protein
MAHPAAHRAASGQAGCAERKNKRNDRSPFRESLVTRTSSVRQFERREGENRPGGPEILILAPSCVAATSGQVRRTESGHSIGAVRRYLRPSSVNSSTVVQQACEGLDIAAAF